MKQAAKKTLMLQEEIDVSKIDTTVGAAFTPPTVGARFIAPVPMPMFRRK